ncbi:MAG TPA: tripartite tricarboxylate transporter substrate binding protein [Xanthobacteraceae bacterium]|jgi:tripartite-type tricarboxylate transporter receptor subunit TctC|nr:tripartite tricarboxylate transporter substrate binding protein [Xanthobacteraceae bacterium]
MITRRLTALVVAAGVACGIGAALAATDWPTRPITLIVPFSPGGPADAPGRVLIARMSGLLGQPMIMENIDGAGGMIGSVRVMRAPPDGYEVLYGNIGTHAQNQSLYKKPLYNAETDFTPVSLLWTSIRVLVVRKDLPAKNLQEFIAYAREKGLAMKFGASGVGGSTHVACLLMNEAMGVQTTHVPYRGTAPALEDLIGGRIDYICDSVQTALPFLQNGSLRALAMLSPTRSPLMPDVPTAEEQGLPGVDAGAWGAFFYPRGVAAPIVQRMSKAVDDAMNTPAVHDRIEAMGVSVTPPDQRGPDYLAKFVDGEIKKWAVPIKKSGVSIE